MKPCNHQKINDFIQDIQTIKPEQAEILQAIRALFIDANKKITEEIKYGGLVFLHSGSLIGGIFPYKQHLSIEFSNGVEFSDPKQLLEGKGKRRRHLKIHSQSDIENKEAMAFITQSVSEPSES